MDLSKSNDPKRTLINANIPTNISLIIHCLLHSICISKPNKRIHQTLSLSLSLYVWCSSLCLSVCLCLLLLLHHCSKLSPHKKKKKKPIALMCCEWSVSIVSTNRIKAPPLFHLHHCSSTIVSTLFLFFLSFYVVSAMFFFFFSTLFWNTVNGSQRIMWQHRFVRTQNTYSI